MSGPARAGALAIVKATIEGAFMSSKFARSGAAGSWGYRRVLAAAGVLAVSALLTSCSLDNMLTERPAATAMARPQVHKPTHKVAAAKAPRVSAPKIAAARPEPKARTFEVKMANVTEVAAYGRGPYICSPSGFGPKSHCVARSLFN